MTGSTLEIECLSAQTIDNHLPDLAALLNACVHTGASVGFVLPHTVEDGLAFWSDKVRPAVATGRRLLLVAKADGRLAGSVQLDCDTFPYQPHRAEVAKLLVHPEARRKGIARALMVELETQAMQHGRTLLTLDTAGDAAERLYRSLGYQAVGAIPGYARDPIEDRYDATMFMYKTLEAPGT